VRDRATSRSTHACAPRPAGGLPVGGCGHVTSAGWQSSGTGTMTFGNIGDACTLQYINSKWFCVGNNGAVFA
jgi:hypothetical protein